MLTVLLVAAYLGGIVSVQHKAANTESALRQQLETLKSAIITNRQSLGAKALKDHLDGRLESLGDVRILTIRTASTKIDGTGRYLDLELGKLGWSHNVPGKTGFFYFKYGGRDRTNSPVWEFAASTHREISEYDGKPLVTKLYGQSTPGNHEAIGRVGYNAVKVAVGQVLLARTVDDPTTVYALKIDGQEQREAMSIKYSLMDFGLN